MMMHLSKRCTNFANLRGQSNNIGCHTFGTSEKAFSGTQEIEREVLNALAVDLFKAKENQLTANIAPGGTEANIQAIWVFRNEFLTQL